MEKSHVGMDTKICPICGNNHDIGILLDRRLKNTLEMRNITGYEICPDCQKHLDNGFVALIGIKPPEDDSPKVKFEEANRTGSLAFMRKEAFERVTHQTVTNKFIFIDEKALDILKEMAGGGTNLDEQSTTESDGPET